MKFIGKLSDFNISYIDEKANIVIETSEVQRVIEEYEKLKDVEKLSIEIKQYREKRSLNANNYFWKLLSEYSQEKRVNTIEEYKDRVKRLGIFRRFRIEKENIDTFKKIWSEKGIAWFCEIADTEYIGDIEFKIINAYYGSSSFNSKQMSRLIEDLVEDCLEVGIETKSKEEIQSLIESWGV